MVLQIYQDLIYIRTSSLYVCQLLSDKHQLYQSGSVISYLKTGCNNIVYSIEFSMSTVNYQEKTNMYYDSLFKSYVFVKLYNHKCRFCFGYEYNHGETLLQVLLICSREVRRVCKWFWPIIDRSSRAASFMYRYLRDKNIA